MSFVWPSYTCSLPDSARRFTDLPDETRASGALPSSAVAHLPNFAVYPVSSTDGPSEEDTSSLLGDMLRIAAVRSSVCRFILILPLSLEWRLLETINSLKILHVYRVVERTIFLKERSKFKVTGAGRNFESAAPCWSTSQRSFAGSTISWRPSPLQVSVILFCSGFVLRSHGTIWVKFIGFV